MGCEPKLEQSFIEGSDETFTKEQQKKYYDKNRPNNRSKRC